MTVPVILMAEWPDKFRFELQDPLGGTLALLVLNGEQFWLYQRERPEVLTGHILKLQFSPFPFSAAKDAAGIVLAHPPFEIDRSISPVHPEVELTEGRAVAHLNTIRQTATWDGDFQLTGYALTIEGTSLDGRVINEAKYEDYEFKSGSHFPTKMRVSGGSAVVGKKQEATIVWKDWELSVPNEKKLFQIPQQQTFGRKIKALP
ncbi:MAG TPA: hypothetical protein VIH99_04565 [Bdellovibrionota bacterium]